MNRYLITKKTLPVCFNQVNTFWQCKDNILTMIYFIKYSCGGFGKIWIRNLIYVIFHIFYHSLFTYLFLIWQGNIIGHSPITFSVLILVHVSNLFPLFDDTNLITSWSACVVIISKPTTTDFWRGACIQRTKGYGVFAWYIHHRCRNIGFLFSGLDLKYWNTNRRVTRWWTKRYRSYLQQRILTWYWWSHILGIDPTKKWLWGL